MAEQPQVSYAFTAAIYFTLWVQLVVCLSSKTIATTELSHGVVRNMDRVADV